MTRILSGFDEKLAAREAEKPMRGGVRALSHLLDEARGANFRLRPMGAYASADCARIVRSLRNAAGLTQAHLALALGVSQQRVSNIERGRTPNGTMLLTLLQVAEICGSTLRIEIVPPSGAAVTGATVHPLPVRSEGRAGAVKKSVVRK